MLFKTLLKSNINLLVVLISFVSCVGAQSATNKAGPNPFLWTELSDAPSFPGGQAQIPRGPGPLSLLSGSTSAMDSRDAYCIKISNPSTFQVTSDSNVDGFATANFDTRLYLFDKRGKPLLFNDDTAPSTTPYTSTLTSVSTDGSGYNLTQNGEYILVVAGFSDKPFDSIANDLFNPSIDGVNSANTNASRFAAWENNNPATGDYFLALRGVSYCQDKLDIVATSSSSATDSNLCTGDGSGGFTRCNSNSSSFGKEDITTGYINHDEFLDVAFDYSFSKPSYCLGDGKGGFSSCNELNIVTTNTNEVVLGDINNDGNNDMILSSTFWSSHYICLGNGDGSFQSCTTFVNSNNPQSADIKLAYMNDDAFLDVIIAKFFSLEVCLGNSMGGVGPCTETTLNVNKLGIADFDGDNITDVITATNASSNNICLNDGTGTLTCTAMNTDSNRSKDVATGDLDGDGDQDVVFANINGLNPGLNRVCLNDGSAVFTCSDVSGIAGSYNFSKLGLLNDDNNLDVVFNSGTFTRSCLGNGDGTFSNCSNNTSIQLLDFELGEFGELPPDIMFVNGFE